VGDVVRSVRGPGQEGKTETDDERTDAHLDAGPDPRREAAGAGREGQHERRDREQRQPGAERAVTVDDLELDGQEEQRPTERAVDDEGHGVGGGELAVPEEHERQHRVGPGPLRDEEGGQGDDPTDEGRHDHRRAPTPGGALDEAVGDTGQAEHRQESATPVDRAGGAGVPRLGDVAHADGDHGRRDRQVDEEHPPPRRRGDELPADERAGGSGEAAEPGPGADGPAAVGDPEGALEDGQAGGDEQGGADALQHPGRYEDRGRRGQATGGGGHREPHHPDDEQPSAAEPVAERPAEEQERGEGQGVTRDDPLQGPEADVQRPADVGEGDADDGGVEGRDPRAEDRRGDDPPTPGAAVADGVVGLSGRHPGSLPPTPHRAGPPVRPRVGRLRSAARRQRTGGVDGCGPRRDARTAVNQLDGGERLMDVRDLRLSRPATPAGCGAPSCRLGPGRAATPLRRSETDPEAARCRPVEIVFGTNPARCFVRARWAWARAAGLTEGAAFRGVDRHGRVLDRLSSEGVAIVVERHTGQLGHPVGDFAGHSPHRGDATRPSLQWGQRAHRHGHRRRCVHETVRGHNDPRPCSDASSSHIGP
jgi:hypothetical protein